AALRRISPPRLGRLPTAVFRVRGLCGLPTKRATPTRRRCVSPSAPKSRCKKTAPRGTPLLSVRYAYFLGAALEGAIAGAGAGAAGAAIGAAAGAAAGAAIGAAAAAGASGPILVV